MWQNKILNADDVAETEAFETKIRLASSNKELKCIDESCQCSTIIYRHGPKRKPHFAHLYKGDCDYAEFDDNDKPVLRDVRTALFRHFKSKGYNIELEVKLPKGSKYAHLLIKLPAKQVVLQIATSTTSAKYIESLTSECQYSGYELKWIVIGDPYELQCEKHNYHAMRYQFNHSENRDLLIIDSIASTVSQTKEDPTEYIYKGKNLEIEYRYFEEAIHSFQYIAPLSSLVFVDGEISIDVFRHEYDLWNSRKNIAFEKMKNDIDMSERHKSELNKLQNAPKSSIPSSVLQTTNFDATKKYTAIKKQLVETGKFTGERGKKGQIKYYSLSEIKANKSFNPGFTRYHSYDVMYGAVLKATSGYEPDLRVFLTHMFFSDEKEKGLFLDVYNDMISIPSNPDIVTEILNYVVIESELS